MPNSLVNPQAFAPYDLLTQAVWITDPESARIVWANQSALKVWEADDLEELRSRALVASPTIRANLLQLRDRVAAGERVSQHRTLFPKGTPKRVDMNFGPYPFNDGRIGLLVEAHPVQQVDPEMVRASEAVRYAPLVVMSFSLDGALLQANTLARQTFGNSFSLRSIFVHAENADGLLNHVGKGDAFSHDIQVEALKGKRWFAIEARRFLDPVTGEPAVLMSAHDMTARIEAEQAKEDLVSVVSHELRTPMTAIRGAIDLLAGGMAKDEKELSNELLQIASENARRLSALVDDLLDVRKLASGSLSLKLVSCDLQPLVAHVVALHVPAAKTRCVELVVSTPDAMPVTADTGRIHQVLLNLISNALKHSPPNSSVKITGSADENQIRISVTDEGPGVPDAFRSRIFQRFSQADASSSRAGSGTGLGLYIAKTIIELHGGQLGFENLENGGAMFYFNLPRRVTSPG